MYRHFTKQDLVIPSARILFPALIPVPLYGLGCGVCGVRGVGGVVYLTFE